MDRQTFAIKPPRPVQYRNEGYLFESFDVPSMEFIRPDGARGLNYDENDVFCVLVDPMTRQRVRVHLQDQEMKF